MDRASVHSDGTSTVTSRILIQNGSFFYPKKPGFRRTAVYTAAFGEKSLKKYLHGPGGEASVKLGSDKATRSSTVKDSYRADRVEQSRLASVPMAGSTSKTIASKDVRAARKVAAQPGGATAVVLGTDVDENPAVGGVMKVDMAQSVDPGAIKVSDALGRAGVVCVKPPAAPGAPPRFAKKMLQNVGGDDKVWLGPPTEFPKAGLMAEDLKLAHDPTLKQVADNLPVRGITTKTAAQADRVVRRRAVDAGVGGKTMVDLTDSSGAEFPKTSLWEADTQAGVDPGNRAEAENLPSAGERVESRPPSLRTSAITATTSTITLNYAMERDNFAAALSPVRPRGLPLNAAKTHGGVRRVGNVQAADSVGPSLIGGILPTTMYETTYGAASHGRQPHESRARRSLVKRTQNIGGATTVSLRDDADAAGVRTKLGPAVNPITARAVTARAPNPITASAPVPMHTGRRMVKPQPAPDQVAITEADMARIQAREHRRKSIRRVAPPGGKSTVSLV